VGDNMNQPPTHKVENKVPLHKSPLPVGFIDPAKLDDSETEHYQGEHWSIPWSDLMMVMFVLFAALVTVQAMKQKELETIEKEIEKQIDAIQPLQPSFEPLMQINVFERSKQAISEANMENVDIALMSDQSVKVSVQGPMFFELGKAELRPEVRNFLNKLAVVIRQTPYQVNIVGHTDDYPINTDDYPSNWELSLIRASQVTRYLIQYGQIDPSRFTVMGKSKYEPAVPNKDDRARALNRRVEIIITREPSPVTKGQTP